MTEYAMYSYFGRGIVTQNIFYRVRASNKRRGVIAKSINKGALCINKKTWNKGRIRRRDLPSMIMYNKKIYGIAGIW